MRLPQPRLTPLAESEWTEEQREVVTRASFDETPLNIFATLARHPKLLKRWLVFAVHVLNKSSLAPRERELAILRTGWLCRSEYEWRQHVVIARDCGLSDDEIDRVGDGPQAPGWSEHERALLRAVDELHADAFVSDATWNTLRQRYGEEQLLDLIFAVGNYRTVAMALNSLGVQPEPGLEPFRRKAGE